MKKTSLRDLKREATAHALAEAAFELAMTHGLDGFVIEDVVHSAGYSRRTFANHFSCKEEAVAMAAFPNHGVEELEALVDGLPETTKPLDILFQFVKMQVTVDFFVRMRQLVALTQEHRTLEPFLLIVLRRLQTHLENILGDLFSDQYPPGYYHLLTGAVSEGLLPAMDGSVNVLLPGQPTAEFSDGMTYDAYVEIIFNYLRHGL